MSYDPKQFWEENADFWAMTAYDNDSQWKHIKKFIKPNWKVLEVGCGDGRWSPHFKNYLGTDISQRLINTAKVRYPEKDFQVWDIRDGFLKGFDLIFGYTVLLHLPRLPKFPNQKMMFIEPFRKSGVEYCFNHDYSKHFKLLKTLKDQKVWWRDEK